MATTTFSVRMDSDIKSRLDKFCEQAGLNTSTAINMFARVVVRDMRLPFEVAVNDDPFYSEANIGYLKKLKHDVDDGIRKLTPHELIEVSGDN